LKFANLTTRIAGKGSNAWDLHFEAARRVAIGEVAPGAYLLLSVGDPEPDH